MLGVSHMGLLDSFLGMMAGNAYLYNQTKKEYEKEQEEYNRMINGLDDIQDSLDDLGDSINNAMENRINNLLEQVDDLLSMSSLDNKDNFYMPVLLMLFYEITLYAGQLQDCQRNFLNRLISLHPFEYATDSSSLIYVYSYSDAFNYDNSINGNLRKVGEIGLDSYAWYQIYKDRCIPFGFTHLNIYLRFIANAFYGMPFLLKPNEEYPMFDNFSERLDVCEPVFKLMYEIENNNY